MSFMSESMTPTRPYLIRSLYEWVVDNNCTPYLLVNANYPNVSVPEEFVNDGKIVLNLAPSAVQNLQLDNEFVQFSARFSGASRALYLPIGSILAIYAKENGQGMFFDEGEIKPPPEGGASNKPQKPVSGRPGLRVVK